LEEMPLPEPRFTPRDPARRSARGEDERREELARWRRLLLWSAGLTLPVFLTAMVLPLLPAFRPLLKAQVRCARRTPLSACPKGACRWSDNGWIATRASRLSRLSVPCLRMLLCYFLHVRRDGVVYIRYTCPAPRCAKSCAACPTRQAGRRARAAPKAPRRAQVLGFPAEELVKWAFTTPVQFVIGGRFHVGAWKALRSGRCAARRPVSGGGDGWLNGRENAGRSGGGDGWLNGR